MKSIKIRLVGNFILIVVLTVVILEIFLITAVKKYYYNSVEEILSNQIVVSADFYNRYYTSTDLKENIRENIDMFWKHTNAQVQIIDKNGFVLMDSIGVISKDKIITNDFNKAIKGEKGKWVGKVDYDDVNVMAISYPLRSGDEIVGVLRFITSLRETNSSVRDAALVFIAIGVLGILISGVMSVFLAETIVDPVKNLTCIAAKMASGNFKVRSMKIYDDEIGKLSDTLNYMADEILKNERLKNEFISSVSHELRTPLTSIKGWAITMNSGDMEDKELLRDGLNIIEKESDRLTCMVEELLDFSKFISGKAVLRMEEVNIKNVIEYIKRQMEPRALREKVNFEIKYMDNLPSIYIDINRIKQVLLNVIDNAFNFTESGGKITLSVKNDNEYMYISVKDTGCGISKEELPRVKEKFFKGKSNKSKNGIGLSICDEIVKLHNGRLDIESEINKGTTINIILPL